jgi:DNA-binding IclR family transcriptional regulator
MSQALGAAGIKSDETLFKILEVLMDRGNVGVTELATELDLSKSAVHKHLQSLERNEFVVNDEGSYSLGFKFLTYGRYAQRHNRLSRIAGDTIYQLSEETDRLVTLAVREHNRGVFVYRLNDKYNLSDANGCQEFYLHQNASGKAILSRLSDEDIESIIRQRGLPPATDDTITDRDELTTEINEVRERGYATSVSELAEGAQSVAASLLDPKTGQLAAISISGPISAGDSSSICEEHRELVVDATRELELKMRHSQEHL